MEDEGTPQLISCIKIREEDDKVYKRNVVGKGTDSGMQKDDTIKTPVQKNDKEGVYEANVSCQKDVPVEKSKKKDKSPKDCSQVGSSVSEVVQLKKELGLWDGVGMIIGSIIGSGIFVSPKGVVRYSGSVGMSLLVWLLTGIMAMTGALCCAELGTMIPKSGAFYTYLHEAWGPVVAFLYLWTKLFLRNPSSRAIIAITFANYLLQPLFPECHSPPPTAIRLVAAALICGLGYVNYKKVKWVTKVQDIFTVTKVVALIVIIVAGLHHLALGNTENYHSPMEGTNWEITSIATAFYSTLFAYGGWNTLNYVTEELKDPYKNLPRAIAISVITVTIIYILTNVAYFAVLTPAELLSSNAVAVSFGYRVLGALAWLISIFVACSTFGTTNGGIFVQARLVHRAAHLGHVPQVFTLIHMHNYTPVTSVLFIVVTSLIMLVAPNIRGLMVYASFSNSLAFLATSAGMLWLRYKQPDRHRPVKIWLGFPILFFLMNLFVVVMPIVRQPVEVGISIGVLLLGLPVYYFAIHMESKPQFITYCLDHVNRYSQILFESVPGEEGC